MLTGEPGLSTASFDLSTIKLIGSTSVILTFFLLNGSLSSNITIKSSGVNVSSRGQCPASRRLGSLLRGVEYPQLENVLVPNTSMERFSYRLRGAYYMKLSLS